MQKGQQQRYYYLQDSAWYFKRSEFKEFINAIDDKSVTIEETAFRDFREFPILSKEIRKKTVQEIAASPRLIQQLYEEFRDTGKMAPPTRFKLQYKKAVRELELKQNLAQDYDIDLDRAKAKIVTGYYNSDDIVFSYLIEAAIAPRQTFQLGLK